MIIKSINQVTITITFCLLSLLTNAQESTDAAHALVDSDTSKTHNIKTATTPHLNALSPALNYLLGHWRLTESKLGTRVPEIEIKTQLAQDNRGIILNVYEKNAQNEWEVILVEYMVYDDASDSIYVQWSNRGQVGKGIGHYNQTNKTLSVIDTDMNGTPTLKVRFDMITPDHYVLTGMSPQDKTLWSFGYNKLNTHE